MGDKTKPGRHVLACVTDAATLVEARLNDVRGLVSALSEAVTPERVSQVFAQHAVSLTGAHACALVLLDDEGGVTFLHSEGFASPLVPGLLHDAARSGTVTFPALSSLGAEAPPLASGTTATRLALVPLVTRRRTVGCLALALDEGRADAEERAFLGLLADHAALALDRSRLHEAERVWVEGLEEEASRFRSLVQELDAVFWEADPDTFLFSFVSQRAEPLLGHPAQSWLQPGFWASIIHPEDRTWAVDFCVKCTKDGQDHVFEYRLLAKDGSVHWVRDVVYVLRGADGKPAKLRGVMLDVTRDRNASQASRTGRILRAFRR